MKQKMFTKTKLAASLSLVLGSTAAMQTFAEETATADSELEVIEVTGIRGSLIKSMDIKRTSKGVVDAISAEDMGKFPDTNLAESLQRITGVSIDRQNGEGSRVTVRGFGPDYNLVTLNGRHMPSSSINATSASDSRSFDFGNLASEGISSVEVFKTGRADVSTGGIGSTINLVTLKPLNLGGQQASIGVKGVHDTSSEDGSALTPELSGLYSNTFADGKFGVALTGSYQNRQSGSARASVDNGWRPQTGGQGGWGAIGDGPEHVNAPADGVVYAVPQNALYGFSETERTRTNGQLTLQYRPVENLTATLDYTYSKNEVETNQNISSVWMNFGHNGSEWTDPNGDNVATPIFISENNTGVSGNPPPFGLSEGDLNFSDLVSQVEQSASVNENKSIGLNLEYLVNDNLSFNFDYHSSSAESKPDSIYGNSNTIQMATNIRAQTAIDFSSKFPIVSVLYPSDVNAADFATDAYPNPSNPLASTSGLTPDGVRTTGTSFRNSYMKSEIEQVQFDGSYAFDTGVVESIDFGIGHSKVDNRNAFAMAERATWGGVGDYDDIPNDFLLASQSTIIDRFDNMPGDKSNMLNAFWDVDFQTIADIVGTNYGVPLNADGSPADPAWPCGTTICAPSTYTTDRLTTEETTSAFVQANLSFEIADAPLNVTVGVRYEQTDVTATTLLPDIQSIAWISDNEFAINRGDAVFYEGEGDYDYILPSIDADYEIVEDLILRASYSETLTRAGYGNLTAGGRLDNVNIAEATGSKGNPGLLPIESANIDLSFEYYYGDASYASIGYFRKDVDNFIASSFTNSSPFSVTNPATGQRFDDAVAALPAGDANNSAAIRSEIQAQNPNDDYITPPNSATGEGAKIFGHPTLNDIVDVKFSQPINQDKNEVNGLEFAVQHIFGESGFGTIINYTYVDSDLEYDNGDLTGEGQTPLLGLSDSANFVGFYDKDGIQLRIAYNWRDTFLSATNDAIGPAPVYTEEYGQWDINASYEFNENLTVFAEGINITDETTRTFGRHELMTYVYQQTGPRYNIGLRYKF
ncbi:TonB-dependent receptor [Colwelliaceae bacterium MEBiC 14330]